jgi:hypothetical protein
MLSSYELLLVEPDESRRNIIVDFYLKEVPRWDVVTATSVTAALAIVEEMKNDQGSKFDAAIIDPHLEDDRTFGGGLLTKEKQLAAAYRVAQVLRRANPKIRLLGVGEDTDFMQQQLDTAAINLQSLEGRFSEIPVILRELTDELDKPLVA